MRIQQGDTGDYKVSIRTFLRVVFDDTLLYKYTWTGQNNKLALCKHKNMLIFLRKLLAEWYPGVQMLSFVKIIQNYIKNLPPRLKRTTEDKV